MKQRLTLLLKRILSYLPTRLPVGKTAYNDFLDSIIELTGPIADADSLAWVISNEVMRMNPGRDRASKHTFVRLIRKYAANQIAANKVMELKDKQAKAIEAQKQAEVTAIPQASNGTTQD